MAFTSSLAAAGTDAGHGIQLQVNGQVRNLRLYDRPGDDALSTRVICGNSKFLVFASQIPALQLRKSRGCLSLNAVMTAGISNPS